MTNATQAPPSNGAAVPQTRAVARRDFDFGNMDELERLAKMLFAAGVCPRGVGRTETVAAIILMGREVGLAPVQALQSIMVVPGRQGGGRMSMWGDALLALVRGSGQLQKIDERVEGQSDDRAAICVVQRRGEQERTFSYSLADARRAGLYGNGPDGKPVKPGPWVENPDRQLTMRARSFALRDVFTDILCGLTTTEEALDDAGPRVEVRPQSSEQPPAAASAKRSPHGGDTALPAAQSPPCPFPNSPTIAAAHAASQPATVEGELMATDEQVREIAALREQHLSFKFGVAPAQREEYDAAWKKVLAEYGVDSARKLTAKQAEALKAAMIPF